MKKKIIITKDGSHSLYLSNIGETYHSIHGSVIEALHVFIKNGLHSHKKINLNILEIGFGTGLNALLTIENIKNKRIQYTALEPHPIEKEIYTKLNFHTFISSENKLFLNLHNCIWENDVLINDKFTLYKSKSNLQNFSSTNKFDVIYFDAFSPEKQGEMWNKNIFRKCYELLHWDGFIVTYCAKGVVRRNKKSVGFDIESLDGPPGKRQMTKANKLILENGI